MVHKWVHVSRGSRQGCFCPAPPHLLCLRRCDHATYRDRLFLPPSHVPTPNQSIVVPSSLSSFSPPRNIHVRSALLGAHPAGRVPPPPPPPPSHYFLRVSGSQDEGGGGGGGLRRLLRVSLARFKVGGVGCAAAAAPSFLACFLSPPSPARSLARFLHLSCVLQFGVTYLSRSLGCRGREGGTEGASRRAPRPAPRCATVVVAFGGARAVVRAGSRSAQELYLIEHVCIVGRP